MIVHAADAASVVQTGRALAAVDLGHAVLARIPVGTFAPGSTVHRASDFTFRGGSLNYADYPPVTPPRRVLLLEVDADRVRVTRQPVAGQQVAVSAQETGFAEAFPGIVHSTTRGSLLAGREFAMVHRNLAKLT